jgi:hypothetical protein
MGPSASLDDLEKIKKYLTPVGTQIPDCPPRSPFAIPTMLCRLARIETCQKSSQLVRPYLLQYSVAFLSLGVYNINIL